MDSTPKELEPYVDAFEIKSRRRDEELWLMGIYNMSAFRTVIDQCFNGKKSKCEYFKFPLSKNQSRNFEDMSEEEKEQAKEYEQLKAINFLSRYEQLKTDE